jgi:hypothetical protein
MAGALSTGMPTHKLRLGRHGDFRLTDHQLGYMASVVGLDRLKKPVNSSNQISNGRFCLRDPASQSVAATKASGRGEMHVAWRADKATHESEHPADQIESDERDCDRSYQV